ncbi:TnpV protein [Eubacterium ramulus]|uniref:TnpV protein n=1 Tax=Eubacterium ramulus TaxID=39490 RepID=UPI0022E82883|nr:TnpV protein [Eubacterium ramulus]
MSEETLFEKLGVKYIEKDGIFYPLITLGGEEKNIDVGKYGHMWIDYIRTEYPRRYRSLVRFSELHDKAAEVNEVAYELLEDIENEWLRKHKPKQSNSFVEMYLLRTQARMIAEEVVLHDVVNCFH